MRAYSAAGPAHGGKGEETASETSVVFLRHFTFSCIYENLGVATQRNLCLSKTSALMPHQFQY